MWTYSNGTCTLQVNKLLLLSPCDVTSHPICTNQNPEQLINQECHHNKTNAIPHHPESSLEQDNKKFRFIGTLRLASKFQFLTLFTNFFNKNTDHIIWKICKFTDICYLESRINSNNTDEQGIHLFNLNGLSFIRVIDVDLFTHCEKIQKQSRNLCIFFILRL